VKGCCRPLGRATNAHCTRPCQGSRGSIRRAARVASTSSACRCARPVACSSASALLTASTDETAWRDLGAATGDVGARRIAQRTLSPKKQPLNTRAAKCLAVLVPLREAETTDQPFFSRMKIVLGSLGTDLGSGAPTGLGWGVMGRFAIAMRLAQPRRQDQRSPEQGRQARPGGEQRRAAAPHPATWRSCSAKASKPSRYIRSSKPTTAAT
jgi:hypothetical protein